MDRHRVSCFSITAAPAFEDGLKRKMSLPGGTDEHNVEDQKASWAAVEGCRPPMHLPRTQRPTPHPCSGSQPSPTRSKTSAAATKVSAVPRNTSPHGGGESLSTGGMVRHIACPSLDGRSIWQRILRWGIWAHSVFANKTPKLSGTGSRKLVWVGGLGETAPPTELPHSGIQPSGPRRPCVDEVSAERACGFPLRPGQR